MKLIYIGTNTVTVPGLNQIVKPGSIIDDPNFVEGLKHRPDFQVVKEDTDSFSTKKGKNK
jgi:hypothetical protein